MQKALNTVLASALAFNETFDGVNFGKALAEGLNRLFSDFDFIQLADTLTTFAGNLWDTLVGFITNVDPLAIGKGIGDFFKRLILNILSGVFGTITTQLKKIADWSFLPKWAKDALNGISGAIDDFVDDVDEENKELEKSAKKAAKEIAKDAGDKNWEIKKSTKDTFDENTKAVRTYRANVGHELNVLKENWNKNNNLSLSVSYPNVTADAQSRLNQIKDYWNKNKKLPNLEVLYDDFSGNSRLLFKTCRTGSTITATSARFTLKLRRSPLLATLTTGGSERNMCLWPMLLVAILRPANFSMQVNTA